MTVYLNSEVEFHASREVMLKKRRLKKGINIPSVQESFHRSLKEHALARDPNANGLRLEIIDKFLQKQRRAGLYVFSKNPLNSMVKECNSQTQIIIEDFKTSFNKQNPKTKYSIVLIGGIIIGVVIYHYLPILLGALAQLLEDLSTDRNPPPSDFPSNSDGSNNSDEQLYGHPYPKAPDGQLTWKQLFLLSSARALYLHFFGQNRN